MANPRPATDEERAPLLQVPGRDEDEDSASGAGSAIDFDRRSLIDIARNPKLLTTLEQGLIVLAICLLCLTALFGGLALGNKFHPDRDNRDRAGPIIRTTTTVQTSTEMATITTTQITTSIIPNPSLPKPTPPTIPRPPSKNVRK